MSSYDSVSIKLKAKVKSRGKKWISLAIDQNLDSKIEIKRSLSTGYEVGVDNEGVGFLKTGGNKFSFNVSPNEFLAFEKVALERGLSSLKGVSIIAALNSNGAVEGGLRLKAPWYQFDLSIEVSVDFVGLVHNNTGMLGKASRALRNRTKRLEEACKRDRC